MRFHWFEPNILRHGIGGINSFAQKLEDFGYYSFLQTYSSVGPDPMVLSVGAMQQTKKIKFMFAIRPSVVTAEYIFRSLFSLQVIAPNRTLLNVVHGSASADEHSVAGPNLIQNLYKDRNATERFVKDLTTQPAAPTLLSELFVSGSHPETQSLVQNFATHWAMHYEPYKEIFIFNTKRGYDHQNFNKRIMLLIDLEIISNKGGSVSGGSLLSGTEEYIVDQIKSFEKNGVTDIMFASLNNNIAEQPIHNFVKQYSQEFDTLD